MRFSQQFIDEIRARVPLSQVVGTKVSWDKRKTNPSRGDFWACCPFHGEKSPSFHCDDRKGFYHCFGCGVSGDHVRFMTDKEGLTFPEAVTRLAEMAGLPLPSADPEAERRDKARSGLHDVMEMAARFFEASLEGREGSSARGYLQKRRMGPDVQKRFRLGYASNSRNALKEHLAGKGVSLEQMIETGLLVSGDDIPVAFDRFRDRVMFPITDMRGRVVAFGGRAMSSEAQAKYLNSPETPLFSKGSLLYNQPEAMKAARESGTVIAVEGYVDVIACAMAGFGHTVAPLGTALTENQLALLWRMASEPILCFDGDAAGQRAASRAVDMALPHLQPGKSLRFAVLPEGQDPDDLIGRSGREAFAGVLGEARPLVDMVWAREAERQDLATPERRAELEQRLRAIVRAVADQSVRRHYEQAFAERLQKLFAPAVAVSQGAQRWQERPRGEWQGGRRGQGGFQQRALSGAPVPVSDALNRLTKTRNNFPLREVVIVMTVVNHPGVIGDHFDEVAHLELGSRELDDLRCRVLEVVGEEPHIEAPALRRHLDAIGLTALIGRLDGLLARSGLWQALPDAHDHDSEGAWLQAVALQKRQRTLHKELRDAETALAHEPSEANLARIVEIQRLLASEEGTEALIEGFGTSSGRQAKVL